MRRVFINAVAQLHSKLHREKKMNIERDSKQEKKKKTRIKMKNNIHEQKKKNVLYCV